MSSADLMLVTGASGFIGSWVVCTALQEGLRVRATVRKNTPAKTKHLTSLPGASERLEIVELDLVKSSPEDFERIVSGCTLVAHTASPFIVSKITNEQEQLIKPAVQGTLSVLRAVDSAAGKTVTRVVVTSSTASIASGYPPEKVWFTDKDWSVVETSHPYARSKTLAEKAAWEFYDKRSNRSWTMCTVNPCLVLGPSLNAEAGTSVSQIANLLSGKVPMAPFSQFAVVDVRDVALAHVRALTLPADATDHRRFIVSHKMLWFLEIAQYLREEFGPMGYKGIPTRNMPKWMARLVAPIVPDLKALLPYWGKPGVDTDNTASKEILGIQYRDAKDTVVASGYTVVQQGIVKRAKGFKNGFVPPGGEAALAAAASPAS